jgi:hypothetical protein
MVEVDAFFLPDTRGVSYQVAHQKTTIGIHALDTATGRLSYFHNAGHFAIDGADLDGVLATEVIGAGLPPFAELVDVTCRATLDGATLRARSREIARARLSLSSAENPFLSWAKAAEEQLGDLATRDLSHFHVWAFATVRQAGAMAELLGAWCDWLADASDAGDPGELAPASACLRELAQTLAAQQFRLARVPAGGKRPDFADALRRCATQWDVAQRAIAAHVERKANGTVVAARLAAPTNATTLPSAGLAPQSVR